MRYIASRLTKLLLIGAAPVQKILTGSSGITHIFCTRQALYILSSDGKKEEAEILRCYQRDIERGVLWADKYWKNFFHYYDPLKKRGIGILPGACTECKYYLDKAYSSYRNGSKNKTFFYLGVSAHIVQDVCVPHHARSIAFSRHALYEKWVESNYHLFKTDKDGIYLPVKDPAFYVEYNAIISRDYLPLVIEKSASAFKFATSILLPLAQRSTAGFFSAFLESVTETKC